jgi:hypothetical protein
MEQSVDGIRASYAKQTGARSVSQPSAPGSGPLPVMALIVDPSSSEASHKVSGVADTVTRAPNREPTALHRAKQHLQATRNSFFISVKIASARSRLPRARVMILSACSREMPCFRAKLLTSLVRLRYPLRRRDLSSDTELSSC